MSLLRRQQQIQILLLSPLLFQLLTDWLSQFYSGTVFLSLNRLSLILFLCCLISLYDIHILSILIFCFFAHFRYAELLVSWHKLVMPLSLTPHCPHSVLYLICQQSSGRHPLSPHPQLLLLIASKLVTALHTHTHFLCVYLLDTNKKSVSLAFSLIYANGTDDARRSVAADDDNRRRLSREDCSSSHSVTPNPGCWKCSFPAPPSFV